MSAVSATAQGGLTARWQSVMMNNYGTPPLALVRGSGAEVWDADGNRYLDLVAGIAVNSLGHAHPAVVEAVTKQISTMGHVSNLYLAEPPLELAERLVDLLGVAPQGARVLFCNSGAEALEAAFKMSRRTGRTKLVAAQNAFHGRTMGSLALTGQEPKRAPFAPLPGDVTHVPYGDVDALAAAVSDETAAVVLEPILGEAGAIVPPEGYLQAARDITTRHGALLVLDEVQTGIGRTGHWFAHQAAGVTPDVVTLAKGLAGGLPIGACIGIGAAGDLLEPGQHGTTFGGNPVCAAAALAVLRTIESDGLLAQVDRVGKELAAGVDALDHPLVDSVSGAGLLIGIGLTSPASAAVATAARDVGFLVNNAVPDRVRLVPPLILSHGQAKEFLTALPGILDAAQGASDG
ncbi:MAG TPA: acetylornithine transaminase [Pseudonocardia sp.]|uniref:acetylornithine transaminase n=1 Tax=Pseudonocardia sp. TaxID=60912 RepID=UPI002C353D6B|nr:acetylornithine transaminase [Pseudonocardia sp.]HTF45919.1 acetylornithine transaminase [Pseudonocardia sp.]